MAKLTKSTRKKKIEVDEEVINLELSKSEAKTLAIILQFIGGGSDTARKHVHSLTDLLYRELISDSDYLLNDLIENNNSAIYFNEKSLRFVEE